MNIGTAPLPRPAGPPRAHHKRGRLVLHALRVAIRRCGTFMAPQRLILLRCPYGQDCGLSGVPACQ